MNCARCTDELGDGVLQCASCGLWNTTPGYTGIENKRNRLSDIKPIDGDRLKSGPWDPVFGGGLFLTSVNILGGEPGAGKSTLLLQLADAVAKKNHGNVLYLATEEEEGQIKERADRLKLTGQDKIIIVNGMGGLDVEGLLESEKPVLTLLDSMAGFTGEGTIESDSLAIAKALKTYAAKRKSPAIITNHITKEADYAGYMSLQHAVDALFGFLVEAEDTRLLIVKKNRHGAANVQVRFDMTQTGLRLSKDQGDE